VSKSSKGSGFERELAKQLSRWWTHGDRDDLIWRTSQSGGRATQRAKQAVRTKYGYGDLTFTDPAAKSLFDLLVISAKRGYTHTSRPLQKKDVEKFCTTVLSPKNLGSAAVVKKNISALFSRTKKAGGIDLLDAIDKPDKKGNVLNDWIRDCYRDTELAQLPYWLLIFRRDGGQTCCLLPQELHLELARLNNRTTLQDFGAYTLTISNLLGNKYVLTALSDFLQWCSPESIDKLANNFRGKARVSL
jgi:hypothetical protein